MAQFVPGQSGNPRGRPKAKITPFLEAIGQEKNDSGETNFEALARKMWASALEDDDKSIGKWIVDRLDGLAIAKVEHSGEDGEPIAIKIEYV